jgi:hypothetical protein
MKNRADEIITKMKTYKLIKEYPGSNKLGDIINEYPADEKT